MQVLEIIQRACKRIGISAPSNAVANPAEDVQQLVELLNSACEELVERHDWTFLHSETSFTAVGGELQGTMSAITANGGSRGFKNVTNNTMWNRTTQQPVFGPVSPSQWQARKALALTGPYSEYRIVSGASFNEPSLYFYPAPTGGDLIWFDYSFEWFTKAASEDTYYESIQADDNVLVFDGKVLIASLDWRWRRAKGLSYAEEFASCEQLIAAAIRNDGTRQILNMAGPSQKARPGVFIPIGNWSP